MADELAIISSSLDFVNKEEAGRNSIIKPPHIEKTVHTWPSFVSPGTSDMGLMSQSVFRKLVPCEVACDGGEHRRKNCDHLHH